MLCTEEALNNYSLLSVIIKVDIPLTLEVQGTKNKSNAIHKFRYDVSKSVIKSNIFSYIT